MLILANKKYGFLSSLDKVFCEILNKEMKEWFIILSSLLCFFELIKISINYSKSESSKSSSSLVKPAGSSSSSSS